MSHCEFEPTIRIDCIKDTIELWKRGAAGNGEIATAIEHGSCFAGSAAALYKTTVKPDEDPPIFGGSNPLADDCSGDEICTSLEECCATLSLKSADETEMVDWATVFSMAQMIWNLIRQWRNR